VSQEAENKAFEELKQRAIDLTTPIDFEALISIGVLEKKGAWYQVNKWSELPGHAKAKISATRTGDTLLVKFRAPSKRLAKFPRRKSLPSNCPLGISVGTSQALSWEVRRTHERTAR